jgi:methionyl aminopeptidase
MNEKEQCIRRAASVVSKIIKKLKKETKPGDTGLILDQIAKKIMKEENVYSSSLNYNGFPSSICVSVNDQLTHGIPTNIPFKNGDLISVDVACNYNGYHADAATTFVVGNLENNKITRDKIDNLLNVTKNSLHFAIMSIRPGKTTNQEIGEIINKYVSSRGLYTISEYGGHGIGRKLHEEPFIPNKKIKFLEPL